MSAAISGPTTGTSSTTPANGAVAGAARPAANRGGVEERVCFDLRRHGAVLLWPLGRALLVAVAGFLLLFAEWPVPVAGAILAAVAALGAVAAVWRWDSTRLVITTEKVFLVDGVLRRRASAVLLRSVRDIGLEQSLAGRALGYGTLHAGPLEIEYVPQVQRVCDLVERLAA